MISFHKKNFLFLQESVRLLTSKFEIDEEDIGDDSLPKGVITNAINKSG